MSEQDSLNKLHGMLIRHEGLRLKPYPCSAGKITIGVGRNLEDNGISEAEAMIMLDNDIHRVHEEASREFSWFSTLSLDRQNVVLSMLFNLGMPRFKKFAKVISALEIKDFERAASEMLNSQWAAQVGRRATELAELMRTGQ